ncbi:DUF4202 multi-domain protein [Pyrenophora tritici-repentis]|nr:DUF4202 multi-domain protein [Pyrenophora tritici-repentis]
MPVPMPSNSSSEKSESTTQQQSSAAAQAIQDVGRAANEALAQAGIAGNGQPGQQGQGEKSEAEKEAERRYEEAIEEEKTKQATSSNTIVSSFTFNPSFRINAPTVAASSELKPDSRHMASTSEACRVLRNERQA